VLLSNIFFELLFFLKVWLSSEDTGAYGIDLGTSFSALLEALTAPASSGGPLDGTDVMVSALRTCTRIYGQKDRSISEVLVVLEEEK